MKGFIGLLKKIGIIVFILAIGIFVFLLMVNKSSGFRTGVPTKMSNKGYIIKTWEGSLNVGGLTNTSEGAIPTTWDYTVKKSADSVITKLDKAIIDGHRVKLMYHEKIAHFFWLGDTKYFVYDVEILNSPE